MKSTSTPLSTFNFSLLIRSFLFSLSVVLSTAIIAQQKVIQLYNGTAPGSENWSWNENENSNNFLKTRTVYNVTHPTLTVFLPEPADVNGTAVIVCPGGGFHILLVDREGTDVAKEFNKKGITVFVLRYRLVHILTDDPWNEMMTKMNNSTKFEEEVTPVIKLAEEDAKAAVTYVRQHAGDFRVDGKRIGLMGFSAGGSLAASVAYNYTSEARPDFVAAIYAYTAAIKKTNIKQDAPPIFIAAATDDHIVPVSNSISLYNDWLASKHSAELHLYSKGDHGLHGFPANSWIARFEDWLDVQGFLKPKQ